MGKAKVYSRYKDCGAYEGTIEYDEMNYDNNDFDLYEVVVVDENDEFVDVERYTSFDDWKTAQNDVPGRKSLDMDQERFDYVTVSMVNSGCRYEADACVHVAYVTDSEDE